MTKILDAVFKNNLLFSYYDLLCRLMAACTRFLILSLTAALAFASKVNEPDDTETEAAEL